MALTVELQAYFRTKLGTSVNLTDVEARYGRLLSNQYATVREVLEERLATLASKPLQFSAEDYSENNGANVALMQKLIAQATADELAEEDVPDSAVRIVQPAVQPSRLAATWR